MVSDSGAGGNSSERMVSRVLENVFSMGSGIFTEEVFSSVLSDLISLALNFLFKEEVVVGFSFCAKNDLFDASLFGCSFPQQHCLYFFPEPQGQGSFLLGFLFICVQFLFRCLMILAINPIKLNLKCNLYRSQSP